MQDGFYLVKGVSDSTREKKTIVYVKAGEVYYMAWEATSSVGDAIKDGMQVIRKIETNEG